VEDRGRPTYQLNLRLSEDECALLEAARGKYGSYRLAVLEGLRRLERESPAEPVILLTDDDPTASTAPPQPAPSATPAIPSTPQLQPASTPDNWWLPLGLAARVVGVSEETLRRWALESDAKLRRGSDSQEIEVESLEVPRDVAARLLRVRSQTLVSRAKAGREPQPVPNTNGRLYRIGDLNFTVSEAARHSALAPNTIREMLDSGELASRPGSDGEPRIPVINWMAVQNGYERNGL
jgi:hypothetical protein